MHPSESSVQLWINTLHYFMKEKMEDFIKNLFLLEAQIYSELAQKFKRRNPEISDLEKYYRKIWGKMDVTSDNLKGHFIATTYCNSQLNFDGKKQYYKCIAYIQHISHQAQRAHNEIYENCYKKIRGKCVVNKKRLLHLMKTIMINNAMQRFFPLNKEQNIHPSTSSAKAKHPVRAGETEDENIYCSVDDDFPQSVIYDPTFSRKGKNQARASLIINKCVEHFIKKYDEFVTINHLTEYQIRPILSEIQFLINRLSGKESHSCFKFFSKKTKEKQAKIKILEKLKSNLNDQKSIGKNLTGIGVNNLLKEAEKNSILAKHRHWWGPLFSPTTQTVKSLQRCRYNFYYDQAEYSKMMAFAY